MRLREGRALALAAILALGLSSGASSGPPALDDPWGLAMGPNRSFLVGCRGARPAVAVLSGTGERLREIGPGRLSRPEGLAVDAAGRLAVADPGAGAVLLFDAKGALVSAWEGLAGPRAVAFDGAGGILAAESGKDSIVALDDRRPGVADAIGRVKLPGGAISALKAPSGLAADGGRLAIADSGNGRILIVPLPVIPGAVPEARVLPAPGLDPGALAFGAGGRLHASDRGKVRGWTSDGKEFGSFRAASVRMWFDPRGLATDPEGRVLAVDGSTRRVLATTADLFDGEPSIRLDPSDPASARIEWTTLSERPTVLLHGPDEDCVSEHRDDRPSKRHEVLLRGLRPSTRYFFHAACPLDAFPATTPPRADLALETQRKSYAFLARGNFTGEYAFATPPRSGMTDWASVPVIVLAYRHVTFPQGADGKRPPDRVLSDRDLAVMKAELEKYRVWAWRQSSCKVDLDFFTIVVDEPRDAGQLGDITPLVLGDLERGTAARGRSLDGFWSAIVAGVHGFYANYLAGTVAGSTHELGSCYVGFGPGAGSGWWWFPVHEHGHLIHSMAMCSAAGHFAFPDAPWTLPGKFGEDFSFMAYNWRQMPVRGWLLLKRTAILEGADADSNGVPDDDPRVPLDQKRFGWSPALGGDCLKRLMAGVRTPGFPGGEDTDFEGKVHRLNEGELHWVDRAVPRSVPSLDGRIEAGEWRELCSIPNLTTPPELRALRAKVYAAWDEERFLFAVRSDRRVAAGFDLDAANDGWFHGRDNLRFDLRPDGNGRPAGAEGAVWDFLDDEIHLHDGAHWYRGAYKPGDIAAAAGREGDWWCLECAVPARPGLRIAPGPGKRFALRITLSPDPAGGLAPVGFFDGEEFVYDLECSPGR
jgi:hypothetical protein